MGIMFCMKMLHATEECDTNGTLYSQICGHYIVTAIGCIYNLFFSTLNELCASLVHNIHYMNTAFL